MCCQKYRPRPVPKANKNSNGGSGGPNYGSIRKPDRGSKRSSFVQAELLIWLSTFFAALAAVYGVASYVIPWLAMGAPWFWEYRWPGLQSVLSCVGGTFALVASGLRR